MAGVLPRRPRLLRQGGDTPAAKEVDMLSSIASGIFWFGFVVGAIVAALVAWMI